jgi:P27 family predicted phage terminase small subunit
VGERGPAPTPTAVKKLRGNPGKRALPKDEPQPAMATVADCPGWLKGPARLEWKRVAPELVKLSLLSVLDIAALASYCESHARWRAIERAIAKTTVADALRQGLLRASKEERQYMVSVGARFGFDPASRSRVSTPSAKAPENDPFQEWAKKKALQGGKAS